MPIVKAKKSTSHLVLFLVPLMDAALPHLSVPHPKKKERRPLYYYFFLKAPNMAFTIPPINLGSLIV